jgi:hypothetical protein
VVAPAAVRRPDRGPELDHAAGLVAEEVLVALVALDERLLALPPLPRAGVGVRDLERLVRGQREDRREAEPEGLGGSAVALAEELGRLMHRVGRGDEGADRSGRDRVDLGRVRVGVLRLLA